MGLKDVPPGACGAVELLVLADSTVGGLSAASYSDGPVTASRALISVPTTGTDSNSGISIRLDGTNPTVSQGIFVDNGQRFELGSPVDISNARLIQVGSPAVGNVTVTVHYFR